MLRHWAEDRHPHHWRIALVAPAAEAWYSGMLPGLVAGDYRAEQCCVPLAPLCAAAGVELIAQTACALAPAAPRVELADGLRLSASWLSLNVGSAPRLPERHEALIELLPVRPFAGFAERWLQWQEEPLPLAVIGGGAAGVELALNMAGQVPALDLFSAGPLLAAHPPALRRRALRHLRRLKVTVHEDCRIDEVRGDALFAGGLPVWHGIRAVVATGPAPQPWLAASGLACDAQGFIAIGPTLQSRSHPQLFASGDCASLPDTPHCGVYAVRQAPVLAQNLVHALQGEALASYRPQRHALALLRDGERGALLAWSRLTAEGWLLRRWKDRIDRRFIARHRLAPRP